MTLLKEINAELNEGQAVSQADGSIDISDSSWKDEAKAELQDWKTYSKDVIDGADKDPSRYKSEFGAPRLAALRKLAKMEIKGNVIPSDIVKAYKKVKGYVVSSAGLENMFISRVIR
jgi:hypothetical protein